MVAQLCEVGDRAAEMDQQLQERKWNGVGHTREAVDRRSGQVRPKRIDACCRRRDICSSLREFQCEFFGALLGLRPCLRGCVGLQLQIDYLGGHVLGRRLGARRLGANVRFQHDDCHQGDGRDSTETAFGRVRLFGRLR